MGNKFSCCKGQTNSPYKSKNILGKFSPETKNNETLSSLQHISEREISNETHHDPSINPTAGPLFMLKSNHKGHRRSQANLFEFRPFKKSSSCSTIFIDDSTVSHPNLKNMIKCVSMAVYYHIYNRTSDAILEIFDERIYPLEKNLSTGSLVDIPDPDYRSIYRFMRTLFSAAQLSSECAIITLVYLERLLSCADVDILPCTWRRILLAAILLASKVWDDQAVWNVDYCQILRDMSIEDMNELERRFLELLQFNINVPSSVYAKYYFELRNLAEQNDFIFPAEPLDEVRAQKLEAMSRVCETNLISLQKNIKKWSSVDNIPFQRKSAAILS